MAFIGHAGGVTAESGAPQHIEYRTAVSSAVTNQTTEDQDV